MFATGIVSAETVWLDDLNLASATQGWGDPHKNQSVDGHALTIGGKEFERGFGTHAESILHVNLDGGAQKFSASVGVDDEVNNNPASSVEFFVIGDGKELWHSGVMRAGDAAKDCEVDLTGVKSLVLKVGDAGDGIDYDHADWADAKFETAGANHLCRERRSRPRAGRALHSHAARAGHAAHQRRGRFRRAARLAVSVHDSGNGRAADGIFRAKSAARFEAGFPNRPHHRHVENEPANSSSRCARKIRSARRRKNSASSAAIRLRSRRRWAGTVGTVLPARFRRNESRARRMRWSRAASSITAGLTSTWTISGRTIATRKTRRLRGPFRDAQGNHRAELALSRHERPGGLHPRSRLEGGLVFLARPVDLRRLRGSWQHEQQDAQTYAKWGFDYLKYDWCSYGEIAAGGDPNAKDIPLWGNGSDESIRQARFIPTKSWANFCANKTATSFSAFANTAWPTSGNGAARWTAIAGAPPATSPTPGAA